MEVRPDIVSAAADMTREQDLGAGKPGRYYDREVQVAELNALIGRLTDRSGPEM